MNPIQTSSLTAADAQATQLAADAARLREFLHRHPRVLVLTGAGCSTESGIPDYRDREGGWKRSPPVTHQAFMGEHAVRQRYWARSLVGWPMIRAAQPNAAHRALAELDRRGALGGLVTQNVDGLHERAGSRGTIDLHGRIDRVRCQSCFETDTREALQQRLLAANPGWAAHEAGYAPDGDADLDALDFSSFQVPDCLRCGGLLKPDVVFFGASVPPEVVAAAMQALAAADALLVIGSSLMVYSGFRFALRAQERGLPIAALNLGVTRADHLLALKFEQPCGALLRAATNPEHISP